MSQSFRLQEATIDSIHSAFKEGTISCRELVEMYLERIETYDKKGPQINSIITINPKALEEARALDRKLKESALVGPLHGIPVLIKDQVETKDMPTTFGSIAFKNYRSKDDATIVKKLIQAGAIILGKTNLPDFACCFFLCFSSVAGETKNPYALDRDAGGSSGGTGAAIAANFGAVGIGEDTGGSIRVPSSFNNLVGVRVTPGLISRNGICPFKSLQDTAGPMTRTVKDTAILLDILVGYDPTDPFTVAVLRTKIPQSYSSYLDKDGLKRARIGILRGAFGSDEDPDSKKVNEVINRAVEAMRTVGAEIIDPVSVPNLQDFIVATSLNNYQPRHDINSFLAKRPHAPVHSIEEIYRAKQFHPVNDGIKVLAESAADPEAVPEYFKAVVRREQFQAAILNVMALHRLDAIAFPDVRVLPPLQREASSGKWSIQTFPTNTVIASNSGLPAISMPAGFSEKIPIGLELIGKPYDEPTLIKLAHSFEQATHLRRPPESTPPLRNEF